MIDLTNWLFLIVGVAGLITTSVLSILKKPTLSQRAQALAPRWIDWIIGIGGFIVLCFLPLDKSLSIFWAGFWGHIFIANKERYKD